MGYAQNTKVPVERSAAELEKMLRAAGATAYIRGWEEARAAVSFVLEGRKIRFTVPMPRPEEFRATPARGIARSAKSAGEACERETARRWRALVLLVKAKLTAVEEGITTVEREFLANLVLADGTTVEERVLPQIDGSVGHLRLLPGPG